MSDNNLQIENSSLYWWGFPVLPDKLSESDSGYTREVKHFIETGTVKQTSTIKRSNPTMLYFENCQIAELDIINHSEYEQEVINREGLDFYLWEPLCYAYTDDVEDPNWEYIGIWNCGFYAEIHNSHNDSSQIICSELDSIYRYAQRNKLTNVTVHTCDYNVHKVSELYSDILNVICNDVFLDYKVQNTGIWPQNLDGYKNIEKHFISTTWRFTPSRWLINSMLSKYNTDMVWAYKTTKEFDDMVSQSSWLSTDVLKNYPRDYTNDLLTGSRRLNLQAPLSLDIKIHKALEMDELRGDKWPKYTISYDNANPSFQNFINFPLRKYYSRCFVDVISETRFAQPTANISEKFLQAVMFRTPFIMVAPPYTLEYIKELGYKTFSDFWDESYDTEEDHASRLHRLYTVFEGLDGRTQEDMELMYEDMSEIIAHNHNLYLSQTRVEDVKAQDMRNINRKKHTEIKWIKS